MQRGKTGHGGRKRGGPDQVNAARAGLLITDALAQLSAEHRAVIRRSYYLGWTTQIADDVRGKMTSDANVAWHLADAASPCLTGDERTMIFVQLGCGENHLVAERILAVVVREGFPLPAALLRTLTTWLDLYVGTREERRLRALIARVRPHAT